MPIFGQVWLWSSLAFLLGALLCWALVALPARRRVGELEDELASYDREDQPDRSESRHRRRDEFAGYDNRRPMMPGRQEQSALPVRGYAGSGIRDAQPSRTPAAMRSALDGLATSEPDLTDTELADGPRSSAATQYLNLGSGGPGGGMLEAPPEVPAQPHGRGWFDDDGTREGAPLEAITRLQAAPSDVDRRLVDDEGESAPDDGGGTVFTQRTHPIPGELIRQIDDAGQAEQRADEPPDALVDDLADEDAGSRAEQTFESEPAATPSEFKTEIRPAAEVTSLLQPDAEPTGTAPAHGAHGQTEVMPAQPTESPTEVVPASGRRSGADTKSRRGTDESKIMPGVTVHADPAINPLPKRVPSKPRGHTPFGVETSTTPEPAAAGSPDSDAPRGLFESIVPAEDTPVVPPPHRVRGDGDGRGPFGPGSAMPLPDGGSPSSEFTIKASVSALRYCTPESPQFGRTVAEVWFKTSADAERVGFRPVG
jgi:hypothetical protein